MSDIDFPDSRLRDEAVHDAIAALEARIEALAEEIERCRKISLAAKLAFAGGVGWIVLTLLTVVPFEPDIFFGAIAAALGGAVLLGSNASTWTEKETALHAAEAQRDDLIGRIELRVVGEDAPRMLH
jgi:hypothetical protein